MEFASAEQYSRPTFLASGKSSLTIAACSLSGARSEVPETLMPVTPLKSSMPSATPYSVMEVASTGMSAVAADAACSAGVAFAMMRSTPADTKVLAWVAQAAVSPEAF